MIISDIEPGARIAEHYTVRRKIADGSAASVYEAVEPDGARVALKILDPLRAPDAVGRARFQREFEVLSRIAHEGVARPIVLVRHEDVDVLVLEYVNGETLASFLERGRPSVEEAHRMIGKLWAALAACHAADVLHRDLKPANIILHPERGPVILDFGVAWFGSAANLTHTGAVIGSPRYMAPEVFSSSMVDARADVYSLGAIAFELLTGRPVHFTESLPELAAAHLRPAPPSPAAIRPEIGRGLSLAVERAIAPRAEDRFATALEALRAFTSRAVQKTATLERKLSCEKCRSPLILDVEFCPGCGREVSWSLRRGRSAVQLTEVKDRARLAAWLVRRHGDLLRVGHTTLLVRLGHLPVPIAVGVSESSAEQLVAEMREQGGRAEVVRARRIIGARIKAGQASALEAVGAAGAHFAAVFGVGAVSILAGVWWVSLAFLPPLLGVVGMGAAQIYAQRPILGVDERSRPGAAGVSATRARLAGLTTERARRLAAMSVARAERLFVAEVPEPIRADAERALDEALVAIGRLDAQAAYLLETSRSRLSAREAAARAKEARAPEEAIEELAAIAVERKELTEASLAHDLAARDALGAIERIGELLASS